VSGKQELVIQSTVLKLINTVLILLCNKQERILQLYEKLLELKNPLKTKKIINYPT